jgi:hypothetical protein
MKMKVRKADDAHRPTVSNKTLALEIENTKTQFEVSCNWLSSLAENIATFPDMSLEAADLLSKLERRALKGRVKKVEKEKV